jgi:2-C-methyl-D-erythritol 4-phosphate cytidylyltransferase
VAKANVWSVVVAGGSGSRFGRLKQYSLLAGRPVLEHAVQACRPWSHGVVLVVPDDDNGDGDYGGGDRGRNPHGANAVVTGGATRADSVRCGLAAVPPDAQVIVVHDAARPLASRALFDSVIRAVTEGDADGAVPGVTPSDTIKVVDDKGEVTSTLDRRWLVAVQTPQAFRAEVLRHAHEQVHHIAPGATAATDDAMLVEALGGRVQVVPGEPGNLKITTPQDLRTAERLLAGDADRS